MHQRGIKLKESGSVWGFVHRARPTLLGVHGRTWDPSVKVQVGCSRLKIGIFVFPVCGVTSPSSFFSSSIVSKWFPFRPQRSRLYCSSPPPPPLSSSPTLPFHSSVPPSFPFRSPSLFFFTGGDGDQLLGSLGNVVGALYDLLGEELVVHRGGPRLGRGRLTALHLQPGGAGGQQAQGAVDCIQRWPLHAKEGGIKVRVGEEENAEGATEMHHQAGWR